MAVDDDLLEVEDLVAGKASEQLGEGVIPTRAVLVVETISEDSRQLHYVLSHGTQLWDALGMLRSVAVKIEADDLASWEDTGDE